MNCIFYILTQITGTEIKLTEKITKMLPKKNRPCKNYNRENGGSYNSCCTKNIWSILSSQINCTIPGITWVIEIPLKLNNLSCYLRVRPCERQNIPSFTKLETHFILYIWNKLHQNWIFFFAKKLVPIQIPTWIFDYKFGMQGVT